MGAPSKSNRRRATPAGEFHSLPCQLPMVAAHLCSHRRDRPPPLHLVRVFTMPCQLPIPAPPDLVSLSRYHCPHFFFSRAHVRLPDADVACAFSPIRKLLLPPPPGPTCVRSLFHTVGDARSTVARVHIRLPGGRDFASIRFQDKIIFL